MRMLESQTKSLSGVSRELGIPIKNIRRWSILGVEKRPKTGRKPADPEMEANLVRWIAGRRRDGREPSRGEVQAKAAELSNKADFKASKNWYDKFCGRLRKIQDDIDRDSEPELQDPGP